MVDIVLYAHSLTKTSKSLDFKNFELLCNHIFYNLTVWYNFITYTCSVVHTMIINEVLTHTAVFNEMKSRFECDTDQHSAKQRT